MSMSLWTVAGFPRPQQFQLKTTKEAGDFRQENPADFLEMKTPWGEGEAIYREELPFS